MPTGWPMPAYWFGGMAAFTSVLFLANVLRVASVWIRDRLNPPILIVTPYGGADVYLLVSQGGAARHSKNWTVSAYSETVYAAEKRTPVNHEAAAIALGFRSLSGPSRVAIAALRQYGFIDKAGKGAIRVSDLGVRTLHGNAEDKRLALAQAAINPALFKDLAKEHGDASENAIASYLITKKDFSPDGARRAAKAFRATVKLAKEDASGYTDANSGEEPEDMTGNDADSGQDAGRGNTTQPGMFSMSVPFAKGLISVQVRVTGDSLKPAHLARVRKYLEMAEQDWEGEE